LVLPGEPPLAAGHPPAPVSHRRVYLDGWADVPVHRWDHLTPNAEIGGPAIFESSTTTAVARTGEKVHVTPHGWLDIRIEP
jgi:N-methylhydantoinase A